MKYQYKPIKGYRDLTQGEIDAMNAIKAEGTRLEILLEKMRDNKDLDPRWIDIAETHLQQCIMAAARAVARPESF